MYVKAFIKIIYYLTLYAKQVIIRFISFLSYLLYKKDMFGGGKVKAEFTIKSERCKGCGICVTFCPKQVLALDALGKVYVKDIEKCIACGQCELRCPDYAIFVDKVKEAAK